MATRARIGRLRGYGLIRRAGPPGAVALALLLAASAQAASFDAYVNDFGPGTASKPIPLTASFAFRANDFSTDAPTTGAPLGAVSLGFPPGLRLGKGASDAACPADQVLRDDQGCPRGSQVMSGQLETLTPGVDEFGDPRNSSYYDLVGYNAPGGGAINLLTTQDDGSRVVIPVSPAGSALTIEWPAGIAQSGAQMLKLQLDVGQSGGQTSSWVRAVSCPGTWRFSIAISGNGPPVTQTASADCDTVAPPELASPDLGRLPKPSRHGSPGSARLCGRPQVGVQCGPGNGRRTSGGHGKVSHARWPAVTGILWIADNNGRATSGRETSLNDELLGGDGSDRLSGGPGKDILWGDQHPVGNNETQRDTLAGGPGNDWIYSSHGANTISAGAGADIVYAFYGRGTVDCGPGIDTVYVRKALANRRYRLSGCEKVTSP